MNFDQAKLTKMIELANRTKPKNLKPSRIDLTNDSAIATSTPKQKSRLSRKLSDIDITNGSSRKRLLNEEEESFSHALVKWICDGKFTVVQISQIKEQENKIKENETYNIQFSKNKTFDGLVLCLGNKDVCNNYLNLIEKKIDEPKTEQSVKKMGLKDGTIECQNCKNFKREINFSNEEVSLLQQKVKEFENMLMSKNNQLISIRNSYEQEKKKNQDLMSIYKPDDVSNFISLSKTFLKIFVPNGSGYSSDSSGFSNDSSLDNVPLVVSYPMVQVHPSLITELKNYIKVKKEASFIFRKIAIKLFPNEELINSTAKSIVVDYNNEINAILEFFTENKYEFSLKMAKNILAQICVEKRRINKSMNVSEVKLKDHPESTAEEDKTILLDQESTYNNNGNAGNHGNDGNGDNYVDQDIGNVFKKQKLYLSSSDSDDE